MTHPSEPKYRDTWADTAKGIGIILVVYGHAARGIYASGFDIPSSFYGIVDSVLYSFHMPLFFFLSGLFLRSTLEKKGSAGTAWSKVDTIVYPYILWSIVQGIAETALSNYTNGTTDIKSVLSIWSPRAQFWFLYALFFIFIFYIAANKILSKHFAPICLALLLALYLEPNIVPDFYIARLIAANGVFFALGVAFIDLNLKKYLNNNTFALTLIIASLGTQIIYHAIGYRTDATRSVGTLYLAAISIAGVVYASNKLPKKIGTIITYIGSQSMGIYIMHIFFASGTRILLSHAAGTNDYITHLLTGTIAGIIGPMIVVELANRQKIKYLFSAPVSKYFTRRMRENHANQ